MSRSERSTSAWSPRPPALAHQAAKSLELQRVEIVPGGAVHLEGRVVGRAAVDLVREHLVGVEGRTGGAAVAAEGAANVLAVGRADHRSRLRDHHHRHGMAVQFDELDLDGDRGLGLVRDQDPQTAWIRDSGLVPGPRTGHPAVVLHAHEDRPASAVREADDSLNQLPVGELPPLLALNSTTKVSPASTSERSSASSTGPDHFGSAGEEVRQSQPYRDRRRGRPPLVGRPRSSLIISAPVGHRPDRPAPSFTWLRRSSGEYEIFDHVDDLVGRGLASRTRARCRGATVAAAEPAKGEGDPNEGSPDAVRGPRMEVP